MERREREKEGRGGGTNPGPAATLHELTILTGRAIGVGRAGFPDAVRRGGDQAGERVCVRMN
jgi:hypothetical protein